MCVHIPDPLTLQFLHHHLDLNFHSTTVQYIKSEKEERRETERKRGREKEEKERKLRDREKRRERERVCEMCDHVTTSSVRSMQYSFLKARQRTPFTHSISSACSGREMA